MRGKLWSVVVVVLALAALGQAEVLFLNHFDNTTSTTAVERLKADYGRGETAVASWASYNGRPDVISENLENPAFAPKFGTGSVQLATNTGQTLALNYKAQYNVNPGQGSFDCWLFAEGYQNRHFTIFNVTDANNRILIVNDGDSATRGKIEYRIQTAGGAEQTFLSNNAMSSYQWVHLAADWKLDSAVASENFIRLWINGVKEVDVHGFAASTMTLTEVHNMGIFSRNSSAGVDLAWLGCGDEVRITDELISSLYTLDGSDNFTVPDMPFAAPATQDPDDTTGVLFVNHFNNTTGATPSDRLAADFGLGGTAVATLTSFDGRPDVVTENPLNPVYAPKFAGSAQLASNTGQVMAMNYKALDNVDPHKGSFECWLFAEGYQNRHFAIFNVTDANNRILIVNDGDVATGQGKIEYRIQTAGGLEQVFWSTNVMPKYQWVHFAADWKLDSAVASENFIRLWINGIKEIDVHGFVASTMTLTSGHTMGILSRNRTAVADDAWLGLGDEVRITSRLISSLYLLNGNGNLTVPNAPFTTPETPPAQDPDDTTGVLFLNHFNNTTSATPSDRLAADFGMGGTAVASLVSAGGRPDVVTENPLNPVYAPKFIGAVQLANNTGQTMALNYKALGNVDPKQGSFESWLYTEGYQNRHFSIFHVTDANNRILILNDGDSATRGKIEYRIQTAGGLEQVFWSTNVMPKYQWVHLAADWKLDSVVASENFIRLWINGIKEIDVNGFVASTMTLTSGHNMGILSRNTTARVDDAWLGLGDDVRITNRLISSLYILKPSGNLTVPVAPFTTPASTPKVPGDANNDGMVDVGDLGILAANYGGTGKTWEQGDFNGDALVDVGDLGILAANYGTGVNGTLDFNADYAKAFGTTATEDGSEEDTDISMCGALGLPLIAGLALMGLMLVKLEE